MKANLIEYFEQTVSSFPLKDALVDHESNISFSDLEKFAKNLGYFISNKYSITNRPIAIYLPKNNYAVVSFIGVLYSGNCYAPLDLKNPLNRIEAILRNLDPICIISDSSNSQRLESLGLGIEVLDIGTVINNENPREDQLTREDQLNYSRCIDRDPAYIIHTSGSTGTPKGVAISHLSIFDYINWAIETFEISDNEIIGNQAPFVFDNSTLDIYLMMFTGATLHLIPEQLYIFPAKLLEYINSNKVNFIFWVPSVLISIVNLDLLVSIKVPSLKKILFAGEVMPTKHLNYWIKGCKNQDVLFANLYGPTEITVDCTYYIVDREFDDEHILPIGVPCKNTDVLILNDRNELCSTGEIGELCVRGTSLALGYWNNKEKTSEVFTQNPLNNSYPELIYRTGDQVYTNENKEIVFVGRKDFQIKHLGYRIELGEIEHSILSVFDSINACVMYDSKNSEIVLFYESNREIPVTDFRLKLIKVLSKYMIPTKYKRFEKLPLTTSGKIDRNSLKSHI